ncbi:hypothetical protein DPX16_8902 [Anabarilius grahami]|uniref:Immunoglobulin V-set domain-containing protein n=1 Tax=Anabarilius grahami TaxID=495550 RepID=A0A3N0XEK3_ANAGA|nr:hypothetical protein DPX16_8902 [Anabarilius grahami]
MGFKFMGYLNLRSEYPESEFKSKIKLNGDGSKNWTLTIENLTLNDITILGKSVVQTPPDLLMKQAGSAEIECSHSIQNYYVVQWYRQSQSIMDLQLMGFRNIEQDTIETEFNDKIKLKGDGRNSVTLIIHTLTLTDSAVYFYAAYDTVLRITSV